MAGRCAIVLLAGLWIAAMQGCTRSQVASPTPQFTAMNSDTPVPPGADIKKAEDLPKRTPKAKTCVAFGDFCAAEVASPKQPPDVRDQRRSQGIKAYQQALEIDPKNLNAHLGLAKLQTGGGDHDAAIATLQKALQHHPDQAGVWCDLGLAYGRKKDWNAAIEALGKACELDSTSRQFASIRAYALARAGRHDESLACFTRLDGPARAHYNLARMLEHMDQPELCKVHLQRALQLDPELQGAKEMLAGLTQPPPPADGAAPTGPATILQTSAAEPAAAPAPRPAPLEPIQGTPVLLPVPPTSGRPPVTSDR
jgi:tetratricopeptide (TPR) repeat protein